jgi:hypothetical protein
MTSAFSNQIGNRNYLSPIGFKFTIAKEPKVSFFCTSAKLPEITLGTAVQPSYLKDIDVPGEKLTYGDFIMRFFVDENMENYMAIYHWLVGLGFPESTVQYKNLIQNENGDLDNKKAFSDGSLRILNSNYNDVAVVNFKDLFPVSLSSLDFESTESDINYLTAEVIFKYTVYNILDKNNNPL